MAKRIYLGREVSKYATIAGGAIITISSLFFVLMFLGFTITGSDDYCLGTPEDPCVSYGKICNTGPDNYDIYNPDEIKMDFSPSIPNSWIFFKDGRVKKNYFDGTGINFDSAGWRYENFTNATKPRSDRVYVHRFARYSCQDYMLVGLKENPDDLIKWGVGIGAEYLDPFWYGVNDSAATTLVSGNISVELGTPINFTTNLTGAATTCVDIDHPDYGDNYTCGTPNANFTLNISYFRRTDFNDSSTVQTINPPFFMNHTCWTDACSGAIGTSSAFETCSNITINDSGTIRMDIDLRSEWAYGESDPIVRIRAKNTTLLESHNVTLDSNFSNGEYSIYFDNFYPAGEYGFCLRHEVAGESIGFYKGDYIVGNPTYLVWPTYGVNVTTGEIIAGPFATNSGHEVHIYSTSEVAHIKSHQYDEVQNLLINVTGIDIAENVKIYVNDTLTNSLGFIYNTSSGNISETSSTSLNLLNGNSTTFSIPKGATVTNTTMNFTGGNDTWWISQYSIPELANGVLGSPAIGIPKWMCASGPTYCDQPTTAWDGSKFTYANPYLVPAYDSDYTAYIYENYTIDSDYNLGNWSAYFQSGSTITFVQACWSGAWTNIISTTTDYFYSPLTVSVPDACINGTELQIKTTLQYAPSTTTVYISGYGDGLIDYYRYGFPENMTIEVGIPDGLYEYEGTGELNGSDSTTDFVAEVNTFLETCTADADDYCDVPIYFSSDDGGTLTIDNFEVLYTYDPNPITISSSIVQNFLNSSTNDVDIPVYFSMTEGSFNVSDLRYDYKGGNDTISILSYEQGNTSNNETLNLFVYYSSFIKNLPYTWASKLFFIPKTNSSKNVTAYGQTTSIPAYNITTTNYGGDINLSIRLNESFSCLNLSWSQNSTKNATNQINTTWQTLISNLEYLNNTQIWFWADFDNCNASDQRILQPFLEIEGYCVDCEWI